MDTRKNRFWLFPIVILICLFTLPTEVGSQCTVINTVVMTFGTQMVITKTLAGSFACMTTTMTANNCFPGPAFAPGSMLYASAMTMATMNPFCNWSCTCGVGPAPHVTINSGDGLPVELMDFSIE